MVDCYADADFAGLWGNENPKDPICDRSRTGFVVAFSNYSILWVSKLQIDIAIFTLHYEYVVLSHSVSALLPLKSLIKGVIDNFGIDSEKMKFLLISTVYENDNGDIVLATSPRMNPTSNHIAIKYHWFR